MAVYGQTTATGGRLVLVLVLVHGDDGADGGRARVKTRSSRSQSLGPGTPPSSSPAQPPKAIASGSPILIRLHLIHLALPHRSRTMGEHRSCTLAPCPRKQMY